MVMELKYGLSLTDVLCGKTETLPTSELQSLLNQLLTGEPVQYVLGEAEFGPRLFTVCPGVLIPRPETFQLCRWILDEVRDTRCGVQSYRILDIGTGSGCIACTLAAELHEAEVTAWDISDDALRIASENARRTRANILFEKVDALNIPDNSRRWDLIVSNPPYICNKERTTMEANVLEHEPRLALFVPDDDPLLFYRAIARYAIKALNQDGSLFFEINPLYVGDMQQMLCDEGFSYSEVKNDQFGKQRFIRICKSRRT
jgi:release factor glutamine methyltransferase